MRGIQLRSRFVVCIMMFVFIVVVNAPTVSAENEISLTNIAGQDEFKKFSRDMGAFLSYIPSQSSESLGLTGFQMGAEVTAADLNHNKAYMQQAFGDSAPPDILLLPKIHISKGLIGGMGFSAFLSGNPAGDFRLYGGAFKGTLLEGGALTPAVSLRIHGTRLSGLDDLDFQTTGGDLSISKGFATLTPFAGVSFSRIESEYTGSNVLLQNTLDPVETTEPRFFLGTNIAFGFINVTAEADFADVNSLSLRANFGF